MKLPDKKSVSIDLCKLPVIGKWLARLLGGGIGDSKKKS